jgi:hypothetical protein
MYLLKEKFSSVAKYIIFETTPAVYIRGANIKKWAQNKLNLYAMRIKFIFLTSIFWITCHTSAMSSY